MLKNFTRPKDEKPYYYSTTVEENEIVRHEGDPKHAVYQSEIREIQRRAAMWHKWVQKSFPDAYNEWGQIDEQIVKDFWHINRQFMEGERTI